MIFHINKRPVIMDVVAPTPLDVHILNRHREAYLFSFIYHYYLQALLRPFEQLLLFDFMESTAEPPLKH
jgi:hypothetical protein